MERGPSLDTLPMVAGQIAGGLVSRKDFYEFGTPHEVHRIAMISLTIAREILANVNVYEEEEI